MRLLTKRANGTVRIQHFFPQDDPTCVSMTKPEFADECDINKIMKKFKRTGLLGNPLNYKEGRYGDFSSGADFAEVMRRVTDAQQGFSELPSTIRNRFKNDPKEYFDFMVDPSNDQEAFELGLKPKPEPAEPSEPAAPAAPPDPATPTPTAVT